MNGNFWGLGQVRQLHGGYTTAIAIHRYDEMNSLKHSKILNEIYSACFDPSRADTSQVVATKSSANGGYQSHNVPHHQSLLRTTCIPPTSTKRYTGPPQHTFELFLAHSTDISPFSFHATICLPHHVYQHLIWYILFELLCHAPQVSQCYRSRPTMREKFECRPDLLLVRFFVSVTFALFIVVVRFVVIVVVVVVLGVYGDGSVREERYEWHKARFERVNRGEDFW